MKNLLCIGNGSVSKISLNSTIKTKKFNKIKIINFSKNADPLSISNKLKKKRKEFLNVLIGFANIKNLKKNEEMFNLLKKFEFKLIKVIHDRSIIDSDVTIGEGCKIFPGVIINRGSKIKKNVLINTGSIIDHDCYIGDHSQIAPGCVLAGNVKIGRLTLVGMGTKIIQGVKIGKNCFVGAGSVVLKNIPDNSIYAGVPAKLIKK
tara:strand:- start:18418 stop:19032 length:615 start_codon:yes stop_codon:yes gene_type:complete